MPAGGYGVRDAEEVAFGDGTKIGEKDEFAQQSIAGKWERAAPRVPRSSKTPCRRRGRKPQRTQRGRKTRRSRGSRKSRGRGEGAGKRG